MRKKALYCFLVLFAGCAQVPRPSTYPYTFQQQMQAAHHWHVLASQVVEEMTRLAFEPGPSMEPVYIRSNDRSPFGRAFRSFLITELTKQGIPISLSPEPCDHPTEIPVSPYPNDRRKICWDVQIVVHYADRIKPPFPLQNTLLAGLGFGLAEAWNNLSHEAAGAVTAFSLGPLLDVTHGLRTGPLPHSEAIITTEITEITDRGPIWSHNANVFYINDRDRQHYVGGQPFVQKSYAVVDR
jgi:hypothetical protein